MIEAACLFGWLLFLASYLPVKDVLFVFRK
jgi:hypothetical protein